MDWNDRDPTFIHYQTIRKLNSNLIRMTDAQGTADLPLDKIQIDYKDRIIVIPGCLPWNYVTNAVTEEN